MPGIHCVHLTPQEVNHATQVARKRVSGKSKCAANLEENLEWDTRGACAEKAFGIWSGLPWNSEQVEDRYNAPNDFEGVEVKSIWSPKHRLLLKPYLSDKRNPHLPFYAVLSVKESLDTWHILGWMYGRDAMTDRYWDENMPRPCWAVPLKDLTPAEFNYIPEPLED